MAAGALRADSKLSPTLIIVIIVIIVIIGINTIQSLEVLKTKEKRHLSDFGSTKLYNKCFYYLIRFVVHVAKTFLFGVQTFFGPTG